MNSPTSSPLVPPLTIDLPGVGGRIRSTDADFNVVEIPQYVPSGTGDHTYLLIEKSGVSTPEALRRVARALDVPQNAIGYAGLKDTHAVTVQTISVEHVEPEQAQTALADVPGLRVLEASRHGNKLRMGHLRGNRFDLIVRGVTPDAESRATAILDHLAQHGCPNGFGPQRFGILGLNHMVGRALVRQDASAAVACLLDEGLSRAQDQRAHAAREHYLKREFSVAADALPRVFGAERRVLGELARGRTAARAIQSMPRPQARLLVSAFQSALFNELLAQRQPDLGTLEKGDLAYLHDRGAVFAVDDPAEEQARCDALEISPSGPLFGRKSKLATGAPGERERATLTAQGLSQGDFSVPRVGRFDGVRRPFRVPLGEPGAKALELDGEACLRVQFTLPKGSYATTVLAEICKP